MKKASITFLPLSVADLPLLADWLSRPHLPEWWKEGQITLETVREKYLPRIFNEDNARPFIVNLDGIPIGYIQYYCASPGDPDWWPDNLGNGVLGMDQFIADEHNLNKGIGSRFISKFVLRLFENPEIVEIRVDPRPDNVRTIRCYEKVGFKQVGQIDTPDGPAIMMVLDRETVIKQPL